MTKPQTNTKLTQHEISMRRKNSLRNLRTFEIITFITLVIVTIVLAFMLPWGLSDDAERTSTAMLGIGIAIALQAGLMLRKGFTRYQKDQDMNEDSDDSYFRGWKLTYWTPVVVMIILLPWLLSGTFNADGMNAVGAGFTLLALYYVAILLGFLIVPFIILPIELIARGLYGVIVERDSSKVGYLYFGGFIALITAFIFVMSTATQLYHPGVVGGLAGIPAFFGLPGAYYVKNELLLWVGRGIAALLAIIIISMYILARQDSQQKNKQQK